MRDFQLAEPADSWASIARLVDADGSAAQPGFARLAAFRAPVRDLADAVHGLCLLHGQRPGMIEVAHQRTIDPDLKAWLALAADGFASERHWLARLVSAAGPLPSTPNQTASENAVATQHHALEMLACSDRHGCALGAVIALLLDWAAIRRLLDRIAGRVGLEPTISTLPGSAGIHALAASLAGAPAAARGLRFGAEQLLAQQRGLWALIEARATARG